MAQNFSSRLIENRTPGHRFYYGYLIIIVSFILMVFGWGVFYIYGVFFGPLETEFHWTRALTSGAFSISVLISGLVGIAAGRLCDRLGPKSVIMVCTVFLSLGYFLMSRINSVSQFYLVYSILIATGVGGFWAPPVATVARWFTARRGIMTGIVSSGISFGTLALPPLVTAIISHHGWRNAYIIIAVTIFVVVMIAVQFLRHSPERMGLLPYGGEEAALPGSRSGARGFSFSEAVRTRQFWLVALIYLCFGAIQLTVMVHIIPHTVGLGYSPISASVALSLIGGFSLAGRIIIGSVADRIRVKNSAILCLCFLMLSLVWLQFAGGLWQLYLFAALFGFGYGGLSCLQSLIGAELFGLSSLGLITAVFSFSFDVGGAAGPVLAGYIYDLSGSYHWAFLSCVVLIVVALFAGLNLRPPEKSA